MPTAQRKFTYASEKLSQGRRALMAPHGDGGEDGAFLAAFEVIGRLRPEDIAGLPEPASEYWTAIEGLMDTSGLEDPKKLGLHTIRVTRMDESERHDFSNNVDELAHWLSDYEERSSR
jgi:hypothetical protein